MRKTYEYKAVVIEDRGFLNDPEFLEMLNREGTDGWKHKSDQPMGSNRQVILLERETMHDG
jgi:hypothetical protein